MIESKEKIKLTKQHNKNRLNNTVKIRFSTTYNDSQQKEKKKLSEKKN